METKMEPVLNFTNEVIYFEKQKFQNYLEFYVTKLR